MFLFYYCKRFLFQKQSIQIARPYHTLVRMGKNKFFLVYIYIYLLYHHTAIYFPDVFIVQFIFCVLLITWADSSSLCVASGVIAHPLFAGRGDNHFDWMFTVFVSWWDFTFFLFSSSLHFYIIKFIRGDRVDLRKR